MINDEMVVDKLELLNLQPIKSVVISQAEYDLISIPDPSTFYYISDGSVVYAGKHRINVRNISKKYLIGVDFARDESRSMYQIFLYKDGELELVESHSNLSQATKMLRLYQNSHGHSPTKIQIRNLLVALIEHRLSIPEFEQGVLEMYGYKISLYDLRDNPYLSRDQIVFNRVLRLNELVVANQKGWEGRETESIELGSVISQIECIMM